MRAPFSAGGTLRSIKDERGAIYIVMAALCFILILLFAGIAEFGRWLIVKEQAQTAADAAALAASVSGVHRWVKIDVITDRGEEEHCDKDSCWCSSCGTTTISGIVGDERRLLDEGGWKDFCVPECSCGGGDCWFEIRDRWVTYEITSGVWGVEPGKIAQVEKDLTNAVRQALAWKAWPHEGTVGAMLAGRDLYGIRSLISDWDAWWLAWRDVVPSCDYACSKCYATDGREGCGYCSECEDEAHSAFSKVNAKLDWVSRVIAQLEKIKWANQRGGLGPVERMTDDIAHAFFSENLPEQAEESGIQRINVHNQRGDPFYPSVTVYVKAWVKSLWPNFLGVFPERYQVDSCGQGDTFYRDPETQQGKQYGPLYDEGKWRKPPPEACWKD